MTRLLLAAPLAMLITLSMFSFMAWLVASSSSPQPEAESVLRFDVVQVEQEREAQRRQRQLPEPPKKRLVAPQAEAVQSQVVNQSITTDMPSVPDISMALSVDGMQIGKPGPIKLLTNQQLMPLHRIEPRYPQRAVKRKIEGYVVMNFTVDERGVPTDIEVQEGNPRGVFEREAKRALRQWRYQPMLVDGKPVRQEGLQIKLEFKLQK